MEREYIHRKSNGPIRRPSRHNRPPWLLWGVIALVLLAIVIFIILRIAGGKTGSQDEGDAGQAQATPLPEQDLAGAQRTQSDGQQPSIEATPTPEAALPQQSTPDSAPTDMGSFMVVNGSGYQYYSFSTETTNSYISAVTSLASHLEGSAQVYSLVIPTAMDILLSESYLTEHQIDSADQRKAIDSYIIPSILAINPNVKTVSLYTALRQHCNENIYFGTDSTWTQLGGYYAYVEFCGAKGIQALGLDQFEKKTYEGFFGGFANLAGEDSFYSDTVEAYLPGGNTSLTFTNGDGEISDGWQVISDGDGYDSSLLYLIFAAGDQPYKVLTNQDITDGSACLVVQDSFGNFFIPFLTQHYQNVYVVDYRDYSGSIPDLAREKGVSDVIVLSNVIATSNSSAVESFRSLV